MEIQHFYVLNWTVALGVYIWDAVIGNESVVRCVY